MPSKKRRYTPKVKGCYQCSQRRIHCDRAEPECQKCSYKGLECSGLGVRYRFNDGVAARGFGAGKTAQRLYQEKKEGTHRLRRDRDGHDDSSKDLTHQHKETESCTIDLFTGGDTETWAFDNIEACTLEDLGPDQTVECSNVLGDLDFLFDDPILLGMEHPPSSEKERIDLVGESTTLNASGCRFIPSSVSSVPPRTEALLHHFSQYIAGEMMAIDGKHNGYRHLILPLAHTDELVTNAVKTVSTFHIAVRRQLSINSSRIPTWPSPTPPNPENSSEQLVPEQLYSHTIAQLARNQDLSLCDTSTRHSVILAIIILIIGVMVTGSDDFPILFRLLESALESIGGEDGLGTGDLRDFMVRQIRKMRVYAAPFLGEDTGVAVLSSQIHQRRVFDCLKYCSQQRFEQSGAVGAITSLVQQAQEIYLHQAACASPMASSSSWYPSSASITRVKQFREALETFPREAPGEQVLIWATFMAASDCILDEDRAFFLNALHEHYRRSGFVNILRGVEHLHKVWAMRGCGGKWTALLPQHRFFVM